MLALGNKLLKKLRVIKKMVWRCYSSSSTTFRNVSTKTDTPQSQTKHPIAVVGVATYYPGAKNTKQFWENILSKRQQFRRIPSTRLPSAYIDKTSVDHTYGKKAAVIDGYQFDWLKKRIPKSTYQSTDIAQWLALDVSLSMLEDAGYPLGEGLNRETTQVIVGNTLTSEFMRSEVLRLRWPFVNKVLHLAHDRTATTNASANPESHLKNELETNMHAIYKSFFVEPNEDTLAGGLSNTISGRICNYLDLNGGGYTVDGACSSSLIAVHTAADNLNTGEVDFVICGGVDLSIDPFEMIGFSRVGAITDSEMRVYDKRANGFIPGEGCAFVGLKRLEDVIETDKVYAVLDRWGISSDGKGGITAPSTNGQSLAIQRAYKSDDKENADEISFVEGHGTGTVVGDEVELTALSDAFGKSDNVAECFTGMTSLKSLIGHTKAASGIGAFVKAVLSVNRCVLPPLSNPGTFLPHPVFSDVARDKLYPIVKGEALDKENSIRGGVSGMGFGGINVHCSVASPPSSNNSQLWQDHWLTAVNENQALCSSQDSELFVFSESSDEILADKINSYKKEILNCSNAELSDFAQYLSSSIGTKPNDNSASRASIVASNVHDLVQKMESLMYAMKTETDARGTKETVLQLEQIAFSSSSNATQIPTRIGFVFPGQASQSVNMARVLVDRYEWARQMVDRLATSEMKGVMFPENFDQIRANGLTGLEKKLKETRLTQPCIALASLLWTHYLKTLGIRPDYVTGHSLGELNALYAANVFDDRALIEIATMRGECMSQFAAKPGSMLSMSCSASKAEQLIQRLNSNLSVSNLNSVNDTVVSGEIDAIEALHVYARENDITAVKLPVSAAFHSSLMSPAADEFDRRLRNKNIELSLERPKTIPAPRPTVITSQNGLEIELEHSNFDLYRHLRDSLLLPVDWISTTKRMHESINPGGLIVEVGPRRVLSHLIQKNVNLDDDSGSRLSCVEGTIGSFSDINWTIALMHAKGVEIDFSQLYLNRIIREWTPPSKMSFLVNPCERKPFGSYEFSSTNCFDEQEEYTEIEPPIQAPMVQTQIPNQKSGDIVGRSTTDILLEICAKQTGFGQDDLSPEMHLLQDLNLDSIKVRSVVAQTSQQIDLQSPLSTADELRLSNSSIAEIATILDDALEVQTAQSQSGLPTTNRQSVFGLPAWVRSYNMSSTPVDIDITNDAESFLKILDKNNRIAIISPESNPNPIATMFRNNFVELPDEYTEYAIVILPTSDNAQINSFSDWLDTRISSILGSIKQINTKVKNILFVSTSSSSADLNYLDSLRGFAASLHLERPGTNVMSLSFSSQLNPNSIFNRVCSFIATDTVTKPFQYYHFDCNMKCHELVPHVIQSPSESTITSGWSHNDTVFVSGGAKGITAECALGFAKATQSKMVLLGSSNESNSSVMETLDRFNNEGLVAKYYQCDVTDQPRIQDIVQDVQRTWGPVTGLIHGAGINRPCRIEQTTKEDVWKEIGPKLLGLDNLLSCLYNSQSISKIKLLSAFSSSIGVTGMPGNCWYSYSNETVKFILARWQSKFESKPQINALAYSLWDDIGMIQKAEFDQDSMDVSPIPVVDGVNTFLDNVLAKSETEDEVVITSRIGRWFENTWMTDNNRHIIEWQENNRFADSILFYEPLVELITQTHLNIDDDLYLKDHVLNGDCLLPTVFGMEIMAQHAVGLLSNLNLNRQTGHQFQFDDLVLRRPILIDAANGQTIFVNALLLDINNNVVRVNIGTSVDDIAWSSLITVSESEQLSQHETPTQMQMLESDYNPKKHIYGREGSLFHGEMYQRIQKVHSLTSSESVCTVTRDFDRSNTASYFSQNLTHERFVLGDPFYRDSLLQTTILPEPTLLLSRLPSRVKQWTIRVNNTENEFANCRVHTRTLDKTNETTIFNVEVFGTHNECIESLTEFQTTEIAGVSKNTTGEDEFEVTTDDKLMPSSRDNKIFRNLLNIASNQLNITLPCKCILQFDPSQHRIDQKERHKLQSEIVLKHIVHDKNKPQMEWDEQGAPQIVSHGGDVTTMSLSHNDNHSVYVSNLDDSLQACDIELIHDRFETVTEWLNLFNDIDINLQKLFERLLTLTSTSSSNSDSTTPISEINKAGTRLWTVYETLRKSIGITQLVDLSIDSVSNSNGNQFVLFKVKYNSQQETEQLYVLTTNVRFTWPPSAMIAILVQKETASSASVASSSDTGTDLRFFVSFADTNSLCSTIPFTIYAKWMGVVREQIMINECPQLLTDLKHDAFRIVTNDCEVQIADDISVSVGETISAQIRGGEATANNLSIDVDFFNQNSDKTANAKLSMSLLTSSGKPVSVPAYFVNFVEQFNTREARAKSDTEMHISGGGSSSSSTLWEALKPSEYIHLFTFSTRTMLESSNFVGNLYFSQYWNIQRNALDSFLHSYFNEWYHTKNGRSEQDLHCTRNKIQHFNEAMPFDTIRVNVKLQRFDSNGIRLLFDFFNADGLKLALATFDAVWIQNGEVKDFPSHILIFFMKKIQKPEKCLLTD